MPDWKKLVRERMSSLALLPQGSEESIVTELATYLEDDYQDGLMRGLDESEATKRALYEIHWKKLAHGIRRATFKEESVNHRTKGLWLPAMVNLTTAAGLLVIVERLGTQPHIVHVNHLPVSFHMTWVLTLPLAAAAGSLMAKRAQAPSALRLLVGLAPSLVALAVFCTMALVFEVDRWQFPSGFPLEFDYFTLSAVGWVLLPALPLLLGTLPFLKKSDLREG